MKRKMFKDPDGRWRWRGGGQIAHVRFRFRRRTRYEGSHRDASWSRTYRPRTPWVKRRGLAVVFVAALTIGLTAWLVLSAVNPPKPSNKYAQSPLVPTRVPPPPGQAVVDPPRPVSVHQPESSASEPARPPEPEPALSPAAVEATSAAPTPTPTPSPSATAVPLIGGDEPAPVVVTVTPPPPPVVDEPTPSPTPGCTHTRWHGPTHEDDDADD